MSNSPKQAAALAQPLSFLTPNARPFRDFHAYLLSEGYLNQSTTSCMMSLDKAHYLAFYQQQSSKKEIEKIYQELGLALPPKDPEKEMTAEEEKEYQDRYRDIDKMRKEVGDPRQLRQVLHCLKQTLQKEARPRFMGTLLGQLKKRPLFAQEIINTNPGTIDVRRKYGTWRLLAIDYHQTNLATFNMLLTFIPNASPRGFDSNIFFKTIAPSDTIHLQKKLVEICKSNPDLASIVFENKYLRAKLPTEEQRSRARSLLEAAASYLSYLLLTPFIPLFVPFLGAQELFPANSKKNKFLFRPLFIITLSPIIIALTAVMLIAAIHVKLIEALRNFFVKPLSVIDLAQKADRHLKCNQIEKKLQPLKEKPALQTSPKPVALQASRSEEPDPIAATAPTINRRP